MSPNSRDYINLREKYAKTTYYQSSPADGISDERGMLDYLSELASRSDPGSCLYAALGAVGYANLCRRTNMPLEEGRRLGKQCYGQALSLVSEATQNDVIARTDSVVMAVSLLGIYEVRNFESTHCKPDSDFHLTFTYYFSPHKTVFMTLMLLFTYPTDHEHRR
jgi:hypothetical protein